MSARSLQQQEDLHRLLTGQADFADVAIFAEAKGTRASDADLKSAPRRVRGGKKAGLAITVLQPIERVLKPQPEVIFFMRRHAVRVLEAPEINRASGGTGITADRAKDLIMQRLHYRFLGKASLLWAGNDSEEDGFGWTLNFDIVDELPSESRATMPRITIADGTCTIVGSGAAGEAIYYTTNGAAPVPALSGVETYAAPFAVPAGATVRASAIATGQLLSSFTEARGVTETRARSLEQQDDIFYLLASKSELADVKVFSEARGVTESDVEQMLAPRRVGGGKKSGLVLIVTQPSERNADPDAQPLLITRRHVVRVIEIPEVNRASGGTGIAADLAKDYVMQRLQERFLGKAALQWVGNDPWQDAAGGYGWSVSFDIVDDLRGETRSAQPIVSITDGLCTLTGTGAEGEIIYYTTDGTAPMPANATEYAGPFAVSGVTVRASTIVDGREISDFSEEDAPEVAASVDTLTTESGDRIITESGDVLTTES